MTTITTADAPSDVSWIEREDNTDEYGAIDYPSIIQGGMGIVAARPRICDLGYLRQLYKREDGALGYRCPAEPIADYLAKGGDRAGTVGRKCLCNGLLADIGLAQQRVGGYIEPPLVTAGDDVQVIAALVARYGDQYAAADVLDYLLPAQGTADQDTDNPVAASGVRPAVFGS